MKRNGHHAVRSVLLVLMATVAAWTVWGRRAALATQVPESPSGPVAPVALGPAGRVPPGVIVAYGGSMVPNGWLLCDGSEVSRVMYDRLFGVIGTTFGAGDGDTDHSDLGILLADWGCTGGDCEGDLDGDGDTDHSDLGIPLADWGCDINP